MSDVLSPKKPRRTRESVALGQTLRTDGGTEEADAANDEAEDDAETRILYLDVEGLFLDLLGLEVDIDEAVLGVSAVSGSGNLLGNLLSTVAELFDASPSNLLDGLLPDISLPDIHLDDVLDGTLTDRVPSVSDMVFGFVNVLLDIILGAIENGESGEEPSADTDQS